MIVTHQVWCCLCIDIHLAKGVPGCAEVMRKLRVMIGHFEHSTQVTAKLLSAQAASDSPAFKDKVPHKLLQDVVTRRWSTFRALRWARILSRIIQSLVVLGEINCEVPTPEEWAILQQIELALETIEHFQEALEGENTSQLLLSQLLCFINDQETLAPVHDLTRILLADLTIIKFLLQMRYEAELQMGCFCGSTEPIQHRSPLILCCCIL